MHVDVIGEFQAAKGCSLTTHLEQSSILLRIDLFGNASVLWTQGEGTALTAIPSPGGHHLVLLGRVVNGNIRVMQQL